MALKGHLIYWQISEFASDKTELERDLTRWNCQDLLPRNDYKSSVIRALKHILKGDDRFYRRFQDVKESVKFAVVLPEELIGDVIDIQFKKEVIITVDKDSGDVEFDDPNSPLKPIFFDAYISARKTVDSQQFRSFLLKVLRKKCHAVSMRKSGGIYYVNKDWLEELQNVRDIFNLFPKFCTLFEVPIYDDESTKDAIEVAVRDDIEDEIEGLLDEIRKRDEEGKVTSKVLQNRREEVKSLVERVRIHAEDLRTKADLLNGRLSEIQDFFGKALTFEENLDKPFSLRDSLAAL